MPSAIAPGPPGYRPEMGEAYVRALNAGVVPRVPLQGSQSASDLIPNAHRPIDISRLSWRGLFAYVNAVRSSPN